MKEERNVLMMTTYGLVGIVLLAQAKVRSLDEIDIFVNIVQHVLSSGIHSFNFFLNTEKHHYFFPILLKYTGCDCRSVAYSGVSHLAL